jgi:hypothetical protein
MATATAKKPSARGSTSSWSADNVVAAVPAARRRGSGIPAATGIFQPRITRVTPIAATIRAILEISGSTTIRRKWGDT